MDSYDDNDIIKREENGMIKKTGEKISVKINVIPKIGKNRTILYEELGHAVPGAFVIMTDKGISIVTVTDSISNLLLSLKKIDGVNEAIYS